MKFALKQRQAKIAILAAALVGFLSSPSFAIGAMVMGKCGAYGQAIDYPTAKSAIDAARQQCKGKCSVKVTMRHACAAFSIDLTNPCVSFGYAVEPRISSALNAATQKCYSFGGKECVIRAWACDARG